jgi:Family of unknown function (DUF5317)
VAAADWPVILLIAVAAGLLAGLLRAGWGGRQVYLPSVRSAWLLVLAFPAQLLVFFIPATRQLIPANLAPIVLVATNTLLLFFTWVNRDKPGVWLLGLGLLLNLLVIVLNGGLMPISPETVARVASFTPSGGWPVGSHFGTGKDIILPAASTRLWILSDQLLLPNWFPYQVTFSIGDILIAGGAFQVLWAIGRNAKQEHRLAGATSS